LIGTFISTLVAVISNLILPLFGNFTFNWLGQVGMLAMVVAISYSILEHHLFDVKIIFTEIISLILAFVLLAQLLLAVTFTEAIVKAITLFFVGILLYLLVKSVFKEVEQREKMEQIAEDLRIANEHLRVLDKQKSEFVSIASHQLRAPLTAITGYTSMVLEGTYGSVPEKITEVLQKVLDSSRRLAVIIDDFLTISHIEQGKITYKFETVEMKKMVENLVEDFAPRAEAKKLFIHFTTDGYDTYNVTADSGKIQQILSNLLDNAVKYSLTGGIEVRITKDFGLRKTRIMIKDTGIGLSRESIAALFQKFSRAKEVQKVYTDGSGIGLYIGQELIKAHHGRIWVESEGTGKGSSFFIELLSED
jgi:signal transduction histidine kinase